jgi:hypothetical protein
MAVPLATGESLTLAPCAVIAAPCPEERERLLNHSISKPTASTPTPLKTHSHQFILRFYHSICKIYR